MSSIKKIFSVVLFTGSGLLLNAQTVYNSKKSRITLRGNTGISYNFYSSNEQIETRPSYAWNAYGNFTAKIDKVTIPFSFVVNQYGSSNRSPFFQAGASPTYKWAKLHVGDRYMQFSPLIFEGQTFRGIGLELTPRQFRIATFYGRLNKAVDEDISPNSFRLPQYSRKGYGVKIGYGNAFRFVDLIYLHAKDDSSSASFVNPGSKQRTLAKENTVLGLATRLTFLKKFIFQADLAVSGLTPDQSKLETKPDSATRLLKFMSNFLSHNSSTVADFAGQTSLICNMLNFNSNLSYRRVEPSFKSLGTPYMISDAELISWANYVSLLGGKLNINTNISHQHNNLDKNLDTKLTTLTGGLFANAIIDTNFSVSASYTGYNFKNSEGTVKLDDTTRLNQQISQFNLGPGYNFTRNYKLHYIGVNIGLSILDDKNKITSDKTTNNNLSASLNYTLGLIKKAWSFSGSAVYSRYKQDITSYNSYGGTVGASFRLLKDRKLNVRGNVGYFFNKLDSGLTQKNITYSFSASYRYKNHSLSITSNYIYTPPNRINDIINRLIPYAVATKNFAGGLTYAYAF